MHSTPIRLTRNGYGLSKNIDDGNVDAIDALITKENDGGLPRPHALSPDPTMEPEAGNDAGDDACDGRHLPLSCPWPKPFDWIESFRSHLVASRFDRT